MFCMLDIDLMIADAMGCTLLGSHPVGGGCIHDARCLELADGRNLFVKSGGRADLLIAERRGLELLAPHIRVPALQAWGEGWLAMEWMELGPIGRDGSHDLGKQLAALHSVTAEAHGLDHDNFIGATPQFNRRSASWLEFYQNCRLLPQLELAARNRHVLPVSKILSAAANLLADHDPAPALLHGDLWSGNTAALPDGKAVVFDPAPYFGDPETDLAMLELFGGALTSDFLDGYGRVSEERERRRPLYDLYHSLNHLNLFGSGCAGMVRRSLSGIGVE
jgi:fructosamine-3-kinase